MAHPVIEGFRKEWPAAFAGPSLDKLSGNAKRWSTTQNERSRGEIPAECFVPGRPSIVLRDPFLDWWETKLSESSPAASTPPVIRGRRPRSEQVRAAIVG
jgi:hypothetical protein